VPVEIAQEEPETFAELTVGEVREGKLPGKAQGRSSREILEEGYAALSDEEIAEIAHRAQEGPQASPEPPGATEAPAPVAPALVIGVDEGPDPSATAFQVLRKEEKGWKVVATAPTMDEARRLVDGYREHGAGSHYAIQPPLPWTPDHGLTAAQGAQEGPGAPPLPYERQKALEEALAADMTATGPELLAEAVEVARETVLANIARVGNPGRSKSPKVDRAAHDRPEVSRGAAEVVGPSEHGRYRVIKREEPGGPWSILRECDSLEEVRKVIPGTAHDWAYSVVYPVTFTRGGLPVSAEQARMDGAREAMRVGAEAATVEATEPWKATIALELNGTGLERLQEYLAALVAGMGAGIRIK
jgi:hypothetical protein